jgi:hypothetical protein
MKTKSGIPLTETCMNVCWCKCCGEKIVEGQDYFRYNYRDGKFPARLNICYKCIISLSKEFKDKKKEFEALEKMSPKERKGKLILIKALKEKK